MEEIFQTQDYSEEVLKEKIRLPFILKDVKLMDPGTWNETFYDAKTIKEAFHNTNWNSKSIRSLFLDHEDLRTSEWIGFIENPRLVGNMVKGDLHIWDENTAVKVGAAKMRCGISPKVKGNEDENTKEMTSFTFQNFSIVTNPAVKTAYINLMEIKKMAEEKEEKKGDQPEETETETESESQESKEEEMKKKKKKPEEDEDEEEDEKKEMKKKKKKPEEEEEEEMSEDNFSEFLEEVGGNEYELSAWTKFVGKMRKKGWSMKKIAAAFKKKKKLSQELFDAFDMEELSDILARKKKYPYPYKEKTEKMSEKIDDLKDQLKSVEKKLNAPDKKTIKGEPALGGLDSDTAMLGFLQNKIRKGVTA